MEFWLIDLFLFQTSFINIWKNNSTIEDIFRTMTSANDLAHLLLNASISDDECVYEHIHYQYECYLQFTVRSMKCFIDILSLKSPDIEKRKTSSSFGLYFNLSVAYHYWYHTHIQFILHTYLNMRETDSIHHMRVWDITLLC